MSSFIPYHGDACMPVKIVLVVFAAVIDEKILFLVYQLQNISLACFKMGSQLNGQSRTRLLTESSVNAPGEVDPEPLRITPPVPPFGRLHGDTADRTDGRAEIAGYAPLIPIRIACQDDHCP